MLLNLCVTDNYANVVRAEPNRLAECPPWQQQYFKGNNLEIRGCHLDSQFDGRTFWEAAKTVSHFLESIAYAVVYAVRHPILATIPGATENWRRASSSPGPVALCSCTFHLALFSSFMSCQDIWAVCSADQGQ